MCSENGLEGSDASTNVVATVPLLTEVGASKVAAYVRGSRADNTLRAYAADLAHFEGWGGSVPSTDHSIAAYLADHAETLTLATLRRRIATLSKLHEGPGWPNPAKSPLVRATLRGIARAHGAAQRQAKPLLRDDLFRVLAEMGNEVRDIRDRALLLIGFGGGFRRSELVALDHADIERVDRGITINIRRSKTDPLGVGRKIAIPFGRTRHCAVSALETWTSMSSGAAVELAVFRRVDQHANILAGRLAAETVSTVLKQRVAAAGLDPVGYSGHSLRAGFVTSAAQAGAPSWKIRSQTGHKSDAMLARYVRDGNLFVDNPTGMLL